MGLSAALLSQHEPISSATQPTWAYQQRYSVNMSLSAALLSQQGPISCATQPKWAYQQRYSANIGLSAALLSIRRAYQHRLSA